MSPPLRIHTFRALGQHVLLRFFCLQLVFNVGALPRAARSQIVAGPGGSSADGGAPSGSTGQDPDAGAAIASPERALTAAVRALTAGQLPVTTTPAALFETDLSNEEAVRVAALRIRAFLQTLGTPTNNEAAPLDAGLSAETTATMQSEAWEARVELDRARLTFYELSQEKRRELLALHARRQAEFDHLAHKDSEAQRQAREADLARKKALEAAARARSEAERLVSEELARLLGLEQRLLVIEQRFDAVPAEIAARRDALLGWQRRVRDALRGADENPDSLYDSVRAALRAARLELGTALDALSATDTEIPILSTDSLPELRRLANTEIAEAKRTEVAVLALRLKKREEGLRESRAAALLEEIDTLNRERLTLLGALSGEKRAAVTGFSTTGFDQARAEVRHLLLVLRYHRYATSRWLASVRQPGAVLGTSIGRAVAVLIPWTVLLSMFLLWRRRGPTVLSAIERSLEESDRAARIQTPSPALRGFRFFAALHQPLEWLVLFLGMMWLLPGEARGLLEIQLIEVSVGWILAGGFIVNAVNAVFASTDPSKSEVDDATLRLRSLRLISRVIVTFALILILSARLVGQGTIYKWVFSTCWASAVPITLVLVRWWRDTVFRRIERVRKKSRFQRWALSHRSGVLSLGAVAGAAVHLFATGALRIGRVWASSFGFVRRIHAYLFSRELDKLADDLAEPLRPLSANAMAAFDPDQPSRLWIPPMAELQPEALIPLLKEQRGGLFALVGARGIGKTMYLRQLSQNVAGTITFRAADLISSLEDLSAKLASTVAPQIVMIDDVQELIRTAIGGLSRFDELLMVARQHSGQTVFVLAIDDAIWPFLQRSRGDKPAFDEVIRLSPWTEEKIVQLLEDRASSASLVPTFEDLVDELPAGADEIERQDAVLARKTGYYRLVWDYTNGNPGIALHLFRSALGLDGSGLAHVRRFQVPNIAELDRLPDVAVFTLRAILQRPAESAESVSAATGLRVVEIEDVLRFSLAHGYLEDVAGRLRITWTWLRAIRRLLERRHLLVIP